MAFKALLFAAVVVGALCESVPSYTPPAPSYNPPAPSYRAPSPSYEGPTSPPVYNPPEPSYNPPEPSYSPPAPSYRAPSPSYEGPTSPPVYDTSYAVRDDYSGNDFGHQENRNGYDTQGGYSVLLPDGRIQRVSYTVNGDSGYVAQVTYEGEAQYPTQHSSPSYHPTPSYRPTPSYQ